MRPLFGGRVASLDELFLRCDAADLVVAIGTHVDGAEILPFVFVKDRRGGICIATAHPAHVRRPLDEQAGVVIAKLHALGKLR